jgi:SdpC family antimicrobial peptide
MRQRKLIAALAGVALIGSALVGAAHARDEPAPIPATFTQEELVRGVVFATGPVAVELGIADRNVRLSPTSQSNVDAFERRVIDRMSESDGEVLADAAVALTSGDPYQVRDAQIALGESFESALAATDPELVVDPGVRSRCGLIAACISFAILAAVAGVALAVVGETVIAVHANVITATNVGWRSAPGSADEVPAIDASTFTAHLTAALAGR